MGLIEQAWSAAEDIEGGRRMDDQLDAMKADGHDVCQLCGEHVPVYEDDAHEDVLRRLTEHANEADDHVHHSEQGWMLVDDLEHAHQHAYARMGATVRNRSVALLVGMGLVAALVQFLVGWGNVAVPVVVAVAMVIGALTLMVGAGTAVAFVYGGYA